MKKTRHTTEQIIEKLRKADISLGQGQKVPEVCKSLGITEQTYYRWRQKYGGMAPEMVKQLRALEKWSAENADWMWWSSYSLRRPWKSTQQTSFGRFRERDNLKSVGLVQSANKLPILRRFLIYGSSENIPPLF